MKRYLIPILFFLSGLIWHSLAPWSGVALLLLAITSLLLALFLWSLTDFFPHPIQVDKVVDLVEEEFVTQPERQTEVCFESVFNSPDAKLSPLDQLESELLNIFQKQKPNSLPEGIQLTYHLPSQLAKVGDVWHLIQEGVPVRSEEGLMVPLVQNGEKLGAVFLSLPQGFALPDSWMDWFRDLNQALYDALYFTRQNWDAKTGLPSRRMAREKAKEVFFLSHSTSLVILQIKSSPFLLRKLDEFIKLHWGNESALYAWEDDNLVSFVPARLLSRWVSSIQFFVEDADAHGHSVAIGLGFANSRQKDVSLETWWETAKRSMEASKAPA